MGSSEALEAMVDRYNFGMSIADELALWLLLSDDPEQKELVLKFVNGTLETHVGRGIRSRMDKHVICKVVQDNNLDWSLITPYNKFISDVNQLNYTVTHIEGQ